MLSVTTSAWDDRTSLGETATLGSFDISDERRAHVQAYRYWLSRAGKNNMPRLSSCGDLSCTNFAPRMALIERACCDAEANICLLGAELEADVMPDQPATRELFEALLERLPVVTSTKAPVAFEANLPLISSADADYAFRGILLPLADDNDQLSHVLVVMNWRKGVTDLAGDALDAFLDM